MGERIVLGGARVGVLTSIVGTIEEGSCEAVIAEREISRCHSHCPQNPACIKPESSSVDCFWIAEGSINHNQTLSTMKASCPYRRPTFSINFNPAFSQELIKYASVMSIRSTAPLKCLPFSGSLCV